jgi:hypothetical protein
MTTEAQINANRQNAFKSTGPRSSEGKSIACQNSTKHGLLSKDLLVRNEQESELNSFREHIYETISPHGSVEEFLVEKLINAAWRIQRLTKIEVNIIGLSDSYTRNLEDIFWGKRGETLQTLSRYETALERNFYKALHELQRLQAMRSGQQVLAPIAIELNTPSRDEIGFVS